MKKRLVAYIAIGLSLSFFLASMIINASIEQKPVSYYRLMMLRDAMHNEFMTAAVSGQYRALALSMPSAVEQVCVVDVNNVDTSHFLCQIDRICSEWKNKQANVFFLPSGDSFLLEELAVEKPAYCSPIVDGKFFFMLKQKDGKVILDKP